MFDPKELDRIGTAYGAVVYAYVVENRVFLGNEFTLAVWAEHAGGFDQPTSAATDSMSRTLRLLRSARRLINFMAGADSHYRVIYTKTDREAPAKFATGCGSTIPLANSTTPDASFDVYYPFERYPDAYGDLVGVTARRAAKSACEWRRSYGEENPAPGSRVKRACTPAVLEATTIAGALAICEKCPYAKYNARIEKS